MRVQRMKNNALIIFFAFLAALLAYVVLPRVIRQDKHTDGSCPLRQDINMKNLECHFSVRQIDTYDTGAGNFVVPRVELYKGVWKSETTRIVLLNNTNAIDWQANREDAVLAVGLMSAWNGRVPEMMYVATVKGIWRIGEDDEKFAVVMNEINKYSGSIEACSAEAMGLVGDAVHDGLHFYRLYWASGEEIEKCIENRGSARREHN